MQQEQVKHLPLLIIDRTALLITFVRRLVRVHIHVQILRLAASVIDMGKQLDVLGAEIETAYAVELIRQAGKLQVDQLYSKHEATVVSECFEQATGKKLSIDTEADTTT